MILLLIIMITQYYKYNNCIELKILQYVCVCMYINSKPLIHFEFVYMLLLVLEEFLLISNVLVLISNLAN